MKKTLLIVSFVITLFSCTKDPVTPGTTDSVDLSKGLIAYYPFNGNVKDSSGNDRDGTSFNGLGFSTDAHNKNDRAANFDGVDDYISINDQSNAFVNDKISVSFQFNLRNVSTRTSFFVKSGFESASGVSYGAGISLDNQTYLDYTVADPTTNCSLIWSYNPSTLLKSTIQLQANRWYHATIIFNQGLQMIYINGNFNSAKVKSFNSLNRCSSSDFKIGGWWKNDIISINGKVDEFRVYNRILCEEEITTLSKEIL